MTKTFNTLATYMSGLANATLYENWSGDFVKKEFFSAVEKAKERFGLIYKDLNFEELTPEELRLLRFMDFDDDIKNLIPLWLFRILPDDTILREFSEKVSLKKDADDDVRFGCTAYRFVEKVEYPSALNEQASKRASTQK